MLHVFNSFNLESKKKMRTSKEGIDLIKSLEGCKLEAYQDIRGIWTIGYGQTGTGIVEGLRISQTTAEALLKDHLAHLSDDLSAALAGARVVQNQFDALSSFAYNVGLGNFKSSTLLKKIKAGDLYGASQQFKRWVYAGSKEPVKGLVLRREKEEALFLGTPNVS